MATTFFSFQKTALSDYDKGITFTFISRDPIFTTYATGLLGIYSKFYDIYIIYTYIKYTCITYTHVQQVWTLGYAYICPLLKWRRYRILMVLTTRGPYGPDIAHLGILPQFGLLVIEKLSFSCSVLLLVKADADHLAVPNLKKIKMA